MKSATNYAQSPNKKSGNAYKCMYWYIKLYKDSLQIFEQFQSSHYKDFYYTVYYKWYIQNLLLPWKSKHIFSLKNV